MRTEQKGQQYIFLDNLLEKCKNLLFPSQPLPHIFLNLVTTENWRSPEFQGQSSDPRNLQIIASLQINRHEVVPPIRIGCTQDLIANFSDWHQNYTKYAIDDFQYARRNNVSNSGDRSNHSSDNFRQFEVDNEEEESISRREYSIEEAAERVKRSIDYLFDESEGFKKIRDQIIQFLPPRGQPQPNVYIRYDHPQLAEMPLHLWNEFKERNIEPIFCSQETRIQNISFRKKRKPRILLILGDFIDIDNDRDMLAWMDQYPDAEIKVLEMLNTKGVSEAIWKGKWDVLYFGGHSSTEDGKGIIYLKNDVRVTLSDFKNGLAEAAKNGLQLAIFNSCISLGAAADLQSAGVPMVVATRHKMHNLIAPEFLELFLDAYVNIGKPIKDAVWYAKERLRTDSNRHFPCADLLPVVFQIPTTPARLKPLPIPTFIIAFVVGILIFNIHIFGLFGFPKAEAALYDHIMQSRPAQNLDSRIAIVKIDEKDKKFQTDRGAKLQGDESIDDEHLVKLINELKQSGAKTIAMTLGRYNTVPTSPDAKKELDDLIALSPNLITKCQLRASSGIPDRISSEILDRQSKISRSTWGDNRLGFSNILNDSRLGNVVRRILLMGTSKDSECSKATRISLPLQAVLNFLDITGNDVDEKTIYDREVLKFKDKRFNNVIIKNIIKGQGGYTINPSLSEKEMENLTVLLNFKNHSNDTLNTDSIDQISSLSDVISKKHNSFKDKIVLIMGSGNENLSVFSSRDYHLGTSSAFIHVQAIDYLLRVMEGYPVLNGMDIQKYIPIYVTFLFVCALICFYLFRYLQTPKLFAMAMSATTAIELALGYYLSYILLDMGLYWMPTIPLLLGSILANLSLTIYFSSYLSWRYQDPVIDTLGKGN